MLPLAGGECRSVVMFLTLCHLHLHHFRSLMAKDTDVFRENNQNLHFCVFGTRPGQVNLATKNILK